MNPITARFQPLLTALDRYRWLWILPTLVGLAAGVGYALFRPVVWEASQGLLLRDEALSNQGRQGRLDSTDSRKTGQETILELARNQHVVAAALAVVGPPPGYLQPWQWPGEADVTQARDEVTIKAPKGGEFGRSEVVYLSVRRSTRAQALALAAALCDQLDLRLAKLRKMKAEGLIAEIQKNAQTARVDRDEVAGRLQALESLVGSDLGELRTLVESGVGESNLRTALNKIKEELRQAQAKHSANEQLQGLLSAAMKNPNEVLAMPNQLLESQPALRRLKEGLVDAQLRTSQILGRTSPEHPVAQAAIEAEQKIRQNLQAELQTALRGATAELKLSGALVASLERQLADVQGRLNRLAGLRVNYSNLVSELRQRSQRVEEAERSLADALASQGAAQSSGLITRLDSPQTADRPLGPGNVMIAASGLGGGLALGLGLVLLIAPTGVPGGRRLTDYLYGRRKTDSAGRARRATDPPANERRTGQDRRAAS